MNVAELLQLGRTLNTKCPLYKLIVNSLLTKRLQYLRNPEPLMQSYFIFNKLSAIISMPVEKSMPEYKLGHTKKMAWINIASILRIDKSIRKEVGYLKYLMRCIF